jgi:hypothetical protein
MLHNVAHTHWRSSIIREPAVILLAAIAIIAVIGGFILISNYVMPDIHQFCQAKLGALHCYKVQYQKLF